VITDKEIDELLSIIPLGYPSIEIFHLSSKDIGLCHRLNQFTKRNCYGYDLEILGEEFYKNFKNSDIKKRLFNIDKHRYNRHAKLYDYLFISIDLQEIENLDLFLKKFYPIIKNGGKVIFIIDKSYDIYSFEEKLIELNFVAVNEIKDTFREHKIISAQKMHGWGS
jgi:hypothetical protein